MLPFAATLTAYCAPGATELFGSIFTDTPGTSVTVWVVAAPPRNGFQVSVALDALTLWR